VSHKSLFELLASDCKPGNARPPSLKLPLNTSNKAAKVSHTGGDPAGGDNESAGTAPRDGVVAATKPETKFVNPFKAKPTTAAADVAAAAEKDRTKKKSIMDLDSDSDEEAWGKDTALVSGKEKIAELKDKATLLKAKATPADASAAPKLGLFQSGTAPSKENPAPGKEKRAAKSGTMSTKEALKERLRRNKQLTEKNKARFGKHAIAGAPTTDYSAYDLERVGGLPAPHAAGMVRCVVCIFLLDVHLCIGLCRWCPKYSTPRI
jgi:hypothetical protein